MGKSDEAMAMYKESEKICEELGDKAGLGKIYGNQAPILKDWGKLDEAMELHKEEEKIFEELGDKTGLLGCNWNMGILFYEMKQHDEAIKRFKNSIKISEKIKNPRLEKDKKFLAEYEEKLRKGK